MEENTQLPKEYNPGVCTHKRTNGFTAWQMQSDSSGSGPNFDEHVTICVCVLCGNIKISGRKLDSKTQQVNRFNETFHVYVPEAIDAIIKQANYYNEEAKWSRMQANETIKVLERWKSEAITLLSKIDDYADKHPDIKLGMSKVDFTVERAKKFDKVSETATGWRPLLEDVLKLDDLEIAHVPEQLFQKIKTFLYGE